VREGKIRLSFYAPASDTLQSAKRTMIAQRFYRWERDNKTLHQVREADG